MGSWLRLEPQVLQLSYLYRVLVLRAFLVCTFATCLDGFVTSLANGTWQAGSWGWAQRLGVLGVLAPLGINLWGLLWPLLQLNTFELSYMKFHRIVMYTMMGSTVLEQFGGLGVGSGETRQAMLLQGMLFTIHQDPGYLQALAAMVVTYSSTHAFVGPRSLLAAGVGAVAQGKEEASSSNPFFTAIAAGEYFVLSFMAILLVQRPYCRVVGPTERQLPAGSTSSTTPSRQVSRSPSAADHSRRPSETGIQQQELPNHISRSNSSSSMTGGAAPAGTPPGLPVAQLNLSQGYKFKLAAVKGCSAVFMLLFALQYHQATKSSQLTAADDSSTSQRTSILPAVAAVACSALQIWQALMCCWGPAWFSSWVDAVNAASMYMCLAVHVLLMASFWASGGAAGYMLNLTAAQRGHAFHSFLLLAASLAAHEDSRSWFAAQLTGMAVLLRHIHLQVLLDAEPAASTAAGVSGYGLALPEYLLATVVITLLYKFICVGKYSPADGSAPAQQQAEWQRQGSSAALDALQHTGNGRVGFSSKAGMPVTGLEIPQADPAAALPPRSPGRPCVVPASRHGSMAGALESPTSSILKGNRQHSLEGNIPGAATEEVAASSPRKPKQRKSILWADSSFPAEELAKLAQMQATEDRQQAASMDKQPAGSSEDACRVRASSEPQATHKETASPSKASLQLQVTGSEVPSSVAATTTLSSMLAAANPASLPGKMPVVPGQIAPAAANGASTAAESDMDLDDDQQLQWVQRVACDVLMVVIQLPVTVSKGPATIQAALQPSANLSVLLRATAVLGVLVWMAVPAFHLPYLLLRPRQALAHRQLLWSAFEFGLGPAALQVAEVLLGGEPAWSKRIIILVLAGGMGLLDVSVPNFAAWLPPMVSMLLAGYAMQNWSTMSSGHFMMAALELNVYPFLTYSAIRFVTTHLQRVGVRLMMRLLSKRGGKQAPQWRPFWVGTAAVVTQLLVGGLLVSVLMAAPTTLSHLMNPFAVVDALEAEALRLLNSATQPDVLKTLLGACGVTLCLLSLPGLQLLIVSAIHRYLSQWQPLHQHQHGSWSNPGYTMQGTSQATTPQEAELAQEKRMAIDVVSALSATPTLLMISPRLFAAVLWPLEGIAAWRRCVAAIGGLLHLATNLAVHWRTVKHGKEALAKRDLHWSILFVGTSCLISLSNAAAGIPPVWPSLTQQMLYCAGMGLMKVSYYPFATCLPALACCFFGVYAWEKRSTLTWSLMTYEAIEFNVYGIFTYGTGRLVTAISEAVGVDAVYAVFRWCYGTQRVDSNQRRWAVVAAVVSHNIAAIIPMWCIMVGPAHNLPPKLDPFAALAVFKLAVLNMLERMDLAEQIDTLQTIFAVAGVGLFFLAVSSMQALVLNNPAFRNPRQRRYEACKATIMTLGEKTMSTLARLEEKAGPRELRAALLFRLNDVVQGCFPGCTLLLYLLEDGSLDAGSTQRYLVQAAPEAAVLAQHEKMGLTDLPSIRHVCQQKQALFKNHISPGFSGWADWDELYNQCGLDCFLVVPLSCANQDMGALVVASSAPTSLDKYLRKLALDLAQSLSQTLYTLACIGQMRAGDQIIHDILPEKVAQQLRRRVVGSSPSAPSSPNSPSPALDAPWQQLLQQDEQLSPAGSFRLPTSPGPGESAGRKERRRNLMGEGEVPVLYKQWHPCVTVLFADIAGYTAMSNSVEPEQVMMLLHELFSKYDNLCSRYGIYKVETIGDCYMACCGLLAEDPDHALHMVQFGQAILGVSAGVQNPSGGNVHIRVGIHSGRVMSGIVGSIRARYCLFGDTVNTASRMESTGVVNNIQVSEDTFRLLEGLQDDFQPREAISVKGKGIMQTYVLKTEVSDRLRAAGTPAECLIPAQVDSPFI